MKIKPAIVFIAILLIFSGCKEPMSQFEKSYFDLFDTLTSVSGYAENEQEFFGYSEIIYSEMLRLHKLFDIYNNYDNINNIKTINDNAGVAAVKVDSSIIELIVKSKEIYKQSDGTVNIAFGAVLSIWHDYRTQSLNELITPQIPDIELLKEASKHCSIDDIVIDTELSTVFLRDSKMSLDVGAIAKGYAAQSAVNLAKNSGFKSGILNSGGNITAIGKPLDGRENWSIGVQTPIIKSDGTQEIYDVVYTSDNSLSTSGDYQRFFIVEGIKYHHIIDPKTLMPANNYNSVTVLHFDAGIADVLSTAAFILPNEQAVELLSSYNAEAIWILRDNTSIKTDGYA